MRTIVRELARELPARQRKQLAAASSVTVVFVDRSRMRRLNSKFRGKNKPTDVLSFAAVDEGSLGELVIALEVIRAQAREHGLSMQDELAYMLLHGVLHLLGYDHEGSKREAAAMFAIQDRVFARIAF